MQMLFFTLLALLTLLNLAATYLLTRQVARILRRLPQVGARVDGSGPRKGEDLSRFLGAVFEREPELRERAGPYFALFAADSCSICGVIMSDAPAIIRNWSEFHFLVCMDDEGVKAAGLAELPNVTLLRHTWELRERLGIPFVPAGLVISDEQQAVVTGLVNAGEHIESLLESAGPVQLPT